MKRKLPANCLMFLRVKRFAHMLPCMRMRQLAIRSLMAAAVTVVAVSASAAPPAYPWWLVTGPSQATASWPGIGTIANAVVFGLLIVLAGWEYRKHPKTPAPAGADGTEYTPDSYVGRLMQKWRALARADAAGVLVLLLLALGCIVYIPATVRAVGPMIAGFAALGGAAIYVRGQKKIAEWERIERQKAIAAALASDLAMLVVRYQNFIKLVDYISDNSVEITLDELETGLSDTRIYPNIADHLGFLPNTSVAVVVSEFEAYDNLRKTISLWQTRPQVRGHTFGDDERADLRRRLHFQAYTATLAVKIISREVMGDDGLYHYAINQYKVINIRDEYDPAKDEIPSYIRIAGNLLDC